MASLCHYSICTTTATSERRLDPGMCHVPQLTSTNYDITQWCCHPLKSTGPMPGVACSPPHPIVYPTMNLDIPNIYIASTTSIYYLPVTICTRTRSHLWEMVVTMWSQTYSNHSSVPCGYANQPSASHYAYHHECDMNTRQLSLFQDYDPIATIKLLEEHQKVCYVTQYPGMFQLSTYWFGISYEYCSKPIQATIKLLEEHQEVCYIM